MSIVEVEIQQESNSEDNLNQGRDFSFNLFKDTTPALKSLTKNCLFESIYQMDI